MLFIHLARKIVLPLVIISCSLCAVGCTPAEESEAIADLQTALSNLQQNRSLTEQFVRDVKANANPADPNYAQVMDSYENARDKYAHYLDLIESNEKAPSSRSLRGITPAIVQNAAADFLEDATTLLQPSLQTRRIPFQRAVVIPQNLQASLNKLPKKSREKIIDQFDDQVRWRSWSEL